MPHLVPNFHPCCTMMYVLVGCSQFISCDRREHINEINGCHSISTHFSNMATLPDPEADTIEEVSFYPTFLVGSIGSYKNDFFESATCILILAVG